MTTEQDVRSLNGRISTLNKKRDTTIARREVLQDSLRRDIAQYEETYGVSLDGATDAAKAKKIAAEAKKVQSDFAESFEATTQLVELLESGDFAAAARLLGVDPEEETVEAEETIEEGLEDLLGDLGLDAEDLVEEPEEPAEEEPSEGETREEAPEESPEEDDAPVITPNFSFGDLSLGDDEDDEDDEEPVAKTSTSSVKDAVADLEASAPQRKGGLSRTKSSDASAASIVKTAGKTSEKPEEKASSLSNMFLSDDDDEGFGSLLEGTRFKPKGSNN